MTWHHCNVTALSLRKTNRWTHSILSDSSTQRMWDSHAPSGCIITCRRRASTGRLIHASEAPCGAPQTTHHDRYTVHGHTHTHTQLEAKNVCGDCTIANSSDQRQTLSHRLSGNPPCCLRPHTVHVSDSMPTNQTPLLLLVNIGAALSPMINAACITATLRQS